ncbi:sialidase family protein [Mucilaginibacter flavus]|uniref:sialidase family protein n=1 Tax=Mucilaginibacter flavus TaxID=931504 RepID=UPI0025B605B6|nr:sialidase family protein [Mucilaginibacter flavus]MDN3583746.1 sialidase family protein [Mucilaginibacter flavus]
MKKKYHTILFFIVLLILSSVACKKPTQGSEPADHPPIVHTTPPDNFSALTSDSSTNSYFLRDVPLTSPYIAQRGWEGVPAIGIKDSILYAAWYCGKKGEEVGNYITISKSKDWGKTWINNSVIIASKNDFDRQIDPSLWDDKFGNLHLSWTSVSGGWDGGLRGVWNIMIKEENNQTVMTKPVRMFSGEMSVKPTSIGADSSTMIFPVFGPGLLSNTWNGLPSTPTPIDLDGPILYKSQYNESTKTILTPAFLSKIPVVLSKRNYDEEMVVANNDTLYTAVNRELDGLYMTHSKNAGLTWDVPSKLTSLGPLAASRPFFGKLRSGNIILIVNNATWRTKLTAFLSTDNGKSWPYNLVIDNDPIYGSSYPALTEDNTGQLYVCYDQGRGEAGIGRIILSKFTEADIIGNKKNNIYTKIICSFSSLR